MKRTRKDSIERAIDGMLADPDSGEDDGEITVHERGCGEGSGRTCSCTPYVLHVPPASIAKMRPWLRKLDAAVRWT